MKLRDKKTGESYETTMPIVFNIKTNGGGEHTVSCESITELNEKWEDVPEEPKEAGLDHIITLIEAYSDHDDEYYPKEIVEKLKAWKRLKDLGFKCSYHSSGYHRGTFTADFVFDEDKLPIMDTFVAKDLNLLFSGDEE